jgi:hypothetical protein
VHDAAAILERAGVPIGAPRPSVPAGVDPAEVRAAIDQLARVGVDPELREPLLAWLRALRHHWPSRWDELAGAGGHALARTLERDADANRTLKLRRIAIENLATWL